MPAAQLKKTAVKVKPTIIPTKLEVLEEEEDPSDV